MLPRFYAPALDPGDEIVALPEDEAAHLGRVLRLRAGARVRVFDGAGHEWQADVQDSDGRRATLRLVEAMAPAAESPVRLTLAAAVLKGEKMDDVVRDTVMLGVHAIQPLVTARTEISLAVLRRRDRVERWRRIAVSAAKQSGRALVPAVVDAVPLEGWLAERASDAGRLAILVEPDAALTAPRLRDLAIPHALTLLVGPEGGWTADEIAAARRAGADAVTLGPRTLRADAVPLVALAACQALWDHESPSS